MATSTNVLGVRASPAAVFAVLDDARAYARWVVGTRRIRHVDPDWPGEGARFHHAVGIAAGELEDWSRVCRRDPPHHLASMSDSDPPAPRGWRSRSAGRLGLSRRTARDADRRSRRTSAAMVVVPLLSVRNWLSLQRLRHEVERRGERAVAVDP